MVSRCRTLVFGNVIGCIRVRQYRSILPGNPAKEYEGHEVSKKVKWFNDVSFFFTLAFQKGKSV